MPLASDVIKSRWDKIPDTCLISNAASRTRTDKGASFGARWSSLCVGSSLPILLIMTSAPRRACCGTAGLLEALSPSLAAPCLPLRRLAVACSVGSLMAWGPAALVAAAAAAARLPCRHQAPWGSMVATGRPCLLAPTSCHGATPCGEAAAPLYYKYSTSCCRRADPSSAPPLPPCSGPRGAPARGPRAGRGRTRGKS